MNEQIKDLYKQAHGVRHYDGDPALDGNPPTVYWKDEVSAEQFANLIIQTCLSKLEQERFAYADDGNCDTEYDCGYVDGMYRAESLIRKLFGVEE